MGGPRRTRNRPFPQPRLNTGRRCTRRGRGILREIERTAVHEAGHAVVAFYLRQPVELVSIEKGAGFDGRVRFRDLPASFDRRLVFGVADARVATALAGWIAVALATGDWIESGRGAQTDLETARLFANVRYDSAKEVEGNLRWGRDRAEKVLRHKWEATRALSEALLTCVTLKINEYQPIIESAPDIYYDRAPHPF